MHCILACISEIRKTIALGGYPMRLLVEFFFNRESQFFGRDVACRYLFKRWVITYTEDKRAGGRTDEPKNPKSTINRPSD